MKGWTCLALCAIFIGGCGQSSAKKSNPALIHYTGPTGPVPTSTPAEYRKWANVFHQTFALEEQAFSDFQRGDFEVALRVAGQAGDVWARRQVAPPTGWGNRDSRVGMDILGAFEIAMQDAEAHQGMADEGTYNAKLSRAMQTLRYTEQFLERKDL